MDDIPAPQLHADGARDSPRAPTGVAHAARPRTDRPHGGNCGPAAGSTPVSGRMDRWQAEPVPVARHPVRAAAGHRSGRPGPRLCADLLEGPDPQQRVKQRAPDGISVNPSRPCNGARWPGGATRSSGESSPCIPAACITCRLHWSCLLAAHVTQPDRSDQLASPRQATGVGINSCLLPYGVVFRRATGRKTAGIWLMCTYNDYLGYANRPNRSISSRSGSLTGCQEGRYASPTSITGHPEPCRSTWCKSIDSVSRQGRRGSTRGDSHCR